MNDKIELQFTYEAEDYNRARRYIQNRSFFVRYFYLFPVAVIVLTLLFNFLKNPAQFIVAFSRPQGFLPVVIAIIILIPVFYLLNKNKAGFIGGFVVKKQIESIIKSSPALQQPQYLRFDENGLLTRSVLTENLVKWDAFTEATETKDDFYLFTAKKIARFIPKRELANEQQENDLRNLVKEKLGDKVKF